MTDLERVLTFMGERYKFWPEHSKGEMLVFTHVENDQDAVVVSLEGVNALAIGTREMVMHDRCVAAKSTLFEKMVQNMHGTKH